MSSNPTRKPLSLAICAAMLVIGLLALGAITLPTPQADAATPLSTLTYQAPSPLKGVVQHAIHAGGYTYLQLEGAADVSSWVVVMGRGPDAGADIELTVWATHPSFRSPTLKRTFSPLAFATLK